MFFVAILAFFGNAFQYQESFNHCREISFQTSYCKHHKEMVLKNHRSIYYKESKNARD